MTADELVDALAGSLDLLANQLDALLGPDWDKVYVARVLADLRDQAREAAALATEPRDDWLEEAIIALRGLQNDVVIARGTGTEPVVSAWTWGKAAVVLRRAGIPVED